MRQVATCLTFLSLLLVASAYARTLTVCSSGCDFTSIREAADRACCGSVIDVAAETFVENV